MAGIRAALRWGYVAVAVCLLFLGCSSRALAQDDEVDAILAAEASRGAGGGRGRSGSPPKRKPRRR